MHIADLSKGMLGANGIVGGGPPLICGRALAAKHQGRRRGRGRVLRRRRVEPGHHAESMNLASIWNLPAIFVAENNGYAEATSSTWSVATDDIADRAAGFGMPGVIVDGFDFFAVYEAAGEAVARAREGGGPTLIEVKFTRYFGHFEGDQQRYRADEVRRRPGEPRLPQACSGPGSRRRASSPRPSSTRSTREVATADRRGGRRGQGRAQAGRRTTCSPTSTSRTERGWRAMARSITYREAINEALAQEMERDPRVIVMGEDNAGGAGAPGEEDAWGGVLGVTKGLYGKFPGRVLDTPITESAFIGAAVGAATGGLRPGRRADVHRLHGRLLRPDLQPGRQVPLHVRRQGRHAGVIRTMWGAGLRAAAQHSQSLLPVFTHFPGLKVVAPSNPYDAKGLLIQSIRDDDPVIFAEHKMLYDVAGEVPEESYAIPFGEANIVREGGDVTIVAIGRMVNIALGGGRASWPASGIEAEVIDPRTTSARSTPDTDPRESVENTGRLVVVDEANPRCSLASDIAAARGAGGLRRAAGADPAWSPGRTRRCRSPTRWRTCSSRTPRGSRRPSRRSWSRAMTPDRRRHG